MIALNVLGELLNMINLQFEEKGLLVREGGIVDASLVESACRPRKVVDIAPIDRDEDGQGENITGKSKKSIQVVDVTPTNNTQKIQVVNVMSDKLENAKDVNVTSKAAKDVIKKENPQDCIVTYSKDEDASWLKKGKKTVYGYKVHVVTDATDGFFLGGHTTPANMSDTDEFKQLVDEVRLMPNAVL